MDARKVRPLREQKEKLAFSSNPKLLHQTNSREKAQKAQKKKNAPRMNANKYTEIDGEKRWELRERLRRG
jgi:hypothetical protein